MKVKEEGKIREKNKVEQGKENKIKGKGGKKITVMNSVVHLHTD